METMLKRDVCAGGGQSNHRAIDRGSVLVMAAIVAVIVFALAGVLLSFAHRESTASNGDRQRQQAIDAAMAGAVVANSALTSNAAYTGSGLVTYAGGAAQFEVTVATDATAAGGFRRVLTSYGYAPSKAESKSTRTVLQVVDLDPVGFSYGVFAGGNYGDGSASSVIGGMYTGGNITLGNSQDYIGSVSARGNIVTGSNQKITGTLHANGNVSVGSSSTNVYGSAYAGGNITTGGTIRDTAQAGGTIGCSKVQGACIQHSPPPLVPLEQLPTFVWNPANYLPVVPVNMTGTAFITAASNPIQGVYNLSGNADFKKNESLRLTGDTTIVASGNFTLPGTVSNNAAAGVSVKLVLVARGNVTASNNLTIPSTVSTLVYTNGNFDAKNSSTYTGVLYAAGNIILGAHSLITYAPVSAPGFDWTNANPQNFTIRNVSTRETTGSE
jgi:Tfp pilus assembly protein PilV